MRLLRSGSRFPVGVQGRPHAGSSSMCTVEKVRARLPRPMPARLCSFKLTPTWPGVLRCCRLRMQQRHRLWRARGHRARVAVLARAEAPSSSARAATPHSTLPAPTPPAHQLLIKGVRSFSPDNQNVIEFYRPLTLIVGSNGAGKTVRACGWRLTGTQLTANLACRDHAIHPHPGAPDDHRVPEAGVHRRAATQHQERPVLHP